MTNITYTDLEAANTYHSDRLNASWASAPEAERTASIIRAADYLRNNYSFTLTEDVPPALAEANILLALIALGGPLAQAEGGIKRSKKSLEGVGELEVEYTENVNSDPYPAISTMLSLAGVAVSSTSSGRLTMGTLVR